MYMITFVGLNGITSIEVAALDDVRNIIDSGANIMVEWDRDGDVFRSWGDAAGGEAITVSLHNLIE